MKKWMAVLLVCGFALFAGACSQTMPGKYKAEAPGVQESHTAVGAEKHNMETREELGKDSRHDFSDDSEIFMKGGGDGAPAGDEMAAVADIFCTAALNADPDKFFEMLHPAVLKYLEKGFELGEDKISIDQIKVAMKQQMQADPVLKCEAGAAVTVDCEDYIVQMYKEVGLDLEACGKLKVSVSLTQAGVQEAEFGTAKVGGAWYLNDM
jgi:hypothetical protein